MKKLCLAILPFSMMLCACSSGPTVSYVDPNTVDTTSINFSSTDLQTTAASMVNQMLASPVIVQLTQSQSPVMYVSGLTNNTSEFIDTQAITDTISTQLIQSGKFQFVDMNKVNAIKKQLNYQNNSGMVNPSTAAKIGQQVGAQYMFYGDISSITAVNSSQESQYYQITMRLMNIQTGIITWQGQQQIRKVATRKTFGW
ncbi:MAG: penicillin-binding protein activator LpoB [Gammaproteobacteria bacterium]|nr:penicillin-binding protein activator LpoB [Gammaproteobacteria bacterium]